MPLLSFKSYVFYPANFFWYCIKANLRRCQADFKSSAACLMNARWSFQTDAAHLSALESNVRNQTLQEDIKLSLQSSLILIHIR